MTPPAFTPDTDTAAGGGLYRTAIRPILWAHIRRAHAHHVLIALLDTLAILTGSFLALAMIDHFIALPPAARLITFILVSLLAATRILLALPPLLHRPDLTRATQAIERAGNLAPESLDTLVAAFEHPNPAGGAGGGTSPALLAELARQAAERLARIPTPRVPASLQFPLLRAALPLMIIGALLLLTPVPALTEGSRILTPWLESPFATARILVSPGEISLRQTQPLTIVATLDAPPPANTPTLLETSFDNGNTWTHQPMTPRGPAAFVTTLDRVERDLRYRVRSGSTVSPESTARIVTSPFIRRANLTLTGPTGTANRELRGMPVDLPPFEKATLAITTVEPLAVARLYAPGLVRTLTRDPRDPTRCTVELERSALLAAQSPPQSADSDPTSFPPTSTPMDLKLEMVGPRGSVGWSSFRVTLLHDRAPTVSISLPTRPRGGGTATSPLSIRPGDELLVHLIATDDIALQDLQLLAPIPLTLQIPRSNTGVTGTMGGGRRWDEFVLLPADPSPNTPGTSTVTLTATDTLGQTSSTSAAATLLPGAPDLLTINRAVALAEGSRRLATLRRAIEDLAAAIDRLPAASPNSSTSSATNSAPNSATARTRTDAQNRIRATLAAATESLSRFDRITLLALRCADLSNAATPIASAYQQAAWIDLALAAAARTLTPDDPARAIALADFARYLPQVRGAEREIDAIFFTQRRGASASIVLAAADPAPPQTLPDDDAALADADPDTLTRLIITARRATLPPLPEKGAALDARTRQTSQLRLDTSALISPLASTQPYRPTALQIRADTSISALIDSWSSALAVPADHPLDLTEDLASFDRLCDELRTTSPDVAALIADLGLTTRNALLANNLSAAATLTATLRTELTALAIQKSRPRPKLNPTLFLPQPPTSDPATKPASPLPDLSVIAPQYRQAVQDYFDLLGLPPATQPAN